MSNSNPESSQKPTNTKSLKIEETKNGESLIKEPLTASPISVSLEVCKPAKAELPKVVSAVSPDINDASDIEESFSEQPIDESVEDLA